MDNTFVVFINTSDEAPDEFYELDWQTDMERTSARQLCRVARTTWNHPRGSARQSSSA